MSALPASSSVQARQFECQAGGSPKRVGGRFGFESEGKVESKTHPVDELDGGRLASPVNFGKHDDGSSRGARGLLPGDRPGRKSKEDAMFEMPGGYNGREASANPFFGAGNHPRSQDTSQTRFALSRSSKNGIAGWSKPRGRRNRYCRPRVHRWSGNNRSAVSPAGFSSTDAPRWR